MAELTRRRFLRNASIGAVAAGVAAAGPAVTEVLTSGAAASDGAATGTADQGMSGLVAHVVDANSGTVAVYWGTNEAVIHAPDVVRALSSAAR